MTTMSKPEKTTGPLREHLQPSEEDLLKDSLPYLSFQTDPNQPAAQLRRRILAALAAEEG